MRLVGNDDGFVADKAEKRSTEAWSYSRRNQWAYSVGTKSAALRDQFPSGSRHRVGLWSSSHIRWIQPYSDEAVR